MPGGGAAAGRENFRPPWVRESAASSEAAPKPSWPLRKRQSVPHDPEPNPVAAVEEQLANAKASLKKQKVVKPKPENGVIVDDDDNEKPLVKPSSIKKTVSETDGKVKKPIGNKPVEEKLPPKKPPVAKQPTKDEAAARKPPVLLRQTSKEETGKKWRDPLLEKMKDNIDKTIANEIPKGHTLTKNESLRSLLKPVPPPMPPPMPPKLPPPPDFKKNTATPEKLKRLETLKSRPRKRPDWSDMMKEVESGKKLKHVVCNDRSGPIITKANVVKAGGGQYVYESEKENMHNQLLKQINSGVKLKKVKCNDRSRPILEGLRKFRRQLTVEEQIQKSISQANLAEVKEAPPEEEEIDEMDDIDKVRDDLQSTKQLLALELRNKEAQQRENKRLLQRITNLEAELKSERAHVKQEQAKTVISVVDAYDETLVSSLKREVSETKRVADDLERKYHTTAEELDEVQSELEETKRKNLELEKKLEQALKGIYDNDDNEEPTSYFLQRTRDFERQCEVYNQGILPSSTTNSRRPSHAQKQQSIQKSSSEEEIQESSSEEEEDPEEKEKKKLQKEVKMLSNKVRNLNEKIDKARKERIALKMQLKNQQAVLKVERKKYKALKKEVDKMANLMKETEDDEEVDDEETEENEAKKAEEEASEEEEEEEETESESEEETESDSESEEEPESENMEKMKEYMTTKSKKLEATVSALKKGNYLISANVDRLKDDVNRQREESANLQEDLNSVLAELE